MPKGRPRKFDDTLKKFAVKFAKVGFTKEYLCRILDVDSSTLYREFERDPDFYNTINISIQEAHLSVIGKLFENVYKGNQRAIEYVLDRRFKPFWYIEDKKEDNVNFDEHFKQITDAIRKSDTTSD